MHSRSRSPRRLDDETVHDTLPSCIPGDRAGLRGSVGPVAVVISRDSLGPVVARLRCSRGVDVCERAVRSLGDRRGDVRPVRHDRTSALRADGPHWTHTPTRARFATAGAVRTARAGRRHLERGGIAAPPAHGLAGTSFIASGREPATRLARRRTPDGDDRRRSPPSARSQASARRARRHRLLQPAAHGPPPSRLRPRSTIQFLTVMTTDSRGGGRARRGARGTSRRRRHSAHGGAALARVARLSIGRLANAIRAVTSQAGSRSRPTS